MQSLSSGQSGINVYLLIAFLSGKQENVGREYVRINYMLETKIMLKRKKSVNILCQLRYKVVSYLQDMSQGK